MRSRGHRDGRDFALVELLVVIAVIAVLASLLLPALGTARDKVKSVSCLGSLKTMGAAFQLYAGDCSEYIACSIKPTPARTRCGTATAETPSSWTDAPGALRPPVSWPAASTTP